MNTMHVRSGIQRLVVDDERVVRVVLGGPVGPRGFTGPAGPASSGASAEGTQSVPALVTIMDHNLGLRPAGIKFFALDSDEELEPEALTYVNLNRILATWPELTACRWIVS